MEERNWYYVPDGAGGVRPCDLSEWSRWLASATGFDAPFRDGGRRVGFTLVSAGVEVSTVSTLFHGMNHAWGEGRPLLFESMVFGGPHDGHLERYATLAEAENGHKRVVDMVRGNPEGLT